jgi:hypothetical protein
MGDGTEEGPIETPVFSISLSVKQLWALAGLIVTVLGGAFGFGAFVQKTANESSALGKDCEISDLNTRNVDLQRTVDTLTKGLEQSSSEIDTLTLKSEFLNRLAGYLQGKDDISKKLLVDVVCSMWKQSEISKSKYPPAKPGALGDAPLEAADGSLTRPESGLAP